MGISMLYYTMTEAQKQLLLVTPKHLKLSTQGNQAAIAKIFAIAISMTTLFSSKLTAD